MKELVMLIFVVCTAFTLGGVIAGLFNPRMYSVKQHVCVVVAAALFTSLTVTWSIIYGA